MASHQYNPSYAAPPSNSPPSLPPMRLHEPVKAQIMEIEQIRDRSQREQSVLSGMSIEDMEAAETLNSLHKEFHSPKSSQAPPVHVQTTTSYADDQPEPLLSLVTSQYPLAGAVINGSLSAYKTTQSYIPGAEWTERHVGLPVAGAVARISGVEGGLRWALQPKAPRGRGNMTPTTPDVEKGQAEAMAPLAHRRGSDVSFAESLPAYTASDKSPPYEQQTTLARRPPPGWRQQLMISTSGLGIAMSEESLQSLRFCLRWLKWANESLGGSIQNLKTLLETWGQDKSALDLNQDGVDHPMSQSEAEGREAMLAARIAALKAEVLQTIKQVVNVVSTYAGGALPENARNLVHRHLTSLPQRFSIATAMTSNNNNNNNNNTTTTAAAATTTINGANEAATDPTNSANRVMVLAHEGLDMMTQVSRVVNDTLVSAEGWCERLGRRKRPQNGQPQETEQQQQQQQSLLPTIIDEKRDDRFRSMTLDREPEADGDVKMEM